MKTINDVLQDGLYKNEVLALDIAEHCGFYSGLDNYGVQHFPKNGAQPKYMGSDYDQYRAFGRWLRNTITEKGIKVVAAEDVNVGTHFRGSVKLAQFQGILLYICAELDIPVRLFNVSSIKKHTTGDGNADKAKMLKYAATRYHLDFEGKHDACDAACVWFYFMHLYHEQIKR